MLHRRQLITGLISLVAAPAIVRVASIMPVKIMVPTILDYVGDISTIDISFGKLYVDPIWFAMLVEWENDIVKTTGINMEEFYK